MTQLRDIPELSPLREVKTVYDEGAWHFLDGRRRDNFGDFQMGVALSGDRWWYVAMARMGTAPPGGCLWYAPYGDPYSGWTQGAPPGSRPEPPIKSLVVPQGALNIDTHCWAWNPLTRVTTWVHAVSDRSGKYHLERATSSGVDPRPESFQRYSQDVVSAPAEECSLVIDPYVMSGFLFYVKKTFEKPDPYGVTQRVRLYRRPVSLIGFDEEFLVGKEEMVFSPDQDGQGEWGTAHTILQPGICVLPDKSYLMVALGKKPIVRPDGKPAIGQMNRTAAVGFWRSVDQGRTWKPDVLNPRLSRRFLGIVEEKASANCINSAHPWFDFLSSRLYVSMALNREGEVNQVGTRVVTCETTFR